jgi:hypothetical protein
MDATTAIPERAGREGDQPLPTTGVPYEHLGGEIGRLVEKKQAAYGDAFGKSGQVMRVLYPDGIPPEKLDDALAVVRVVDKLFRISTSKDAFGESPWRDIAGYALLAVERDERRRLPKAGG